MPDMQSARRGVADALSKADRRFEVNNTQIASTTQALAGPRFERQTERLCRLGPRVLAEMLGEVGAATGQSSFIADRVAAFADLDPEIVRAVGGDKFPPRLMEVVIDHEDGGDGGHVK